MNRKGKLSKRDIDTLNKAWVILSDYTQLKEDECVDESGEYDDDSYEKLCDDNSYTSAMNAVCGLCDFLGSYGR